MADNTLTLEKMRDAQSLLSQNVQRIPAMPVMRVKEWPQEFSHFETIRHKAHPLVCWLAKFLPIDPWVEQKIPRHKDRQPFVMQGRLFMSIRQADALAAAVPFATA